jgi:hypothetical protein
MIKTLKNIILISWCFLHFNANAGQVIITIITPIELGTVVTKTTNGLCNLTPLTLSGPACYPTSSFYTGQIRVEGDMNSIVTITGTPISGPGYSATPTFYIDGETTEAPSSLTITQDTTPVKNRKRGMIIINIGVRIEITNYSIIPANPFFDFVIDADYL